ncbi:MAG: hypothetical protein LH480_13880, partial [Rubrivivax sp.]|nr:hypothetical protein [Rubrivivax sp.]
VGREADGRFAALADVARASEDAEVLRVAMVKRAFASVERGLQIIGGKAHAQPPSTSGSGVCQVVHRTQPLKEKKQ